MSSRSQILVLLAMIGRRHWSGKRLLNLIVPRLRGISSHRVIRNRVTMSSWGQSLVLLTIIGRRRRSRRGGIHLMAIHHWHAMSRHRIIRKMLSLSSIHREPSRIKVIIIGGLEGYHACHCLLLLRIVWRGLHQTRRRLLFGRNGTP